MRKLVILLMSLSVLIACNNKKGPLKPDDRSTNNRDKDDYSDKDKDDENSKNTSNRDEDNSNSESNWSTSDVRKFVDACVDAAEKGGISTSKATSYCNCMQQKIEKKYPDSKDVGDFDNQTAESKRWAEDCKEKSGLSDSNSDENSDDGGGSWSSKDKNEFVTNCVDEARSNMEYVDAKSYCECMQYKLEKLYPNARDAGKLTEADFGTPSMKRMIKACLPEH